jgi:hypothetical protein
MEWSDFLLSFTFWFNFICLILAIVSSLLFKNIRKVLCDRRPKISFRLIVAYNILFTLRFLYVILGQALPDNYIVNTIIFSNFININNVIIYCFFVKCAFLIKYLAHKRNETNLNKV